MIRASNNPFSCHPAIAGGVLEYEDYTAELTYEGGAQTFTVQPELKNIVIELNDGRSLKKNVDWTYSGSTLTVIFELENESIIYLTGIYKS